MDAEPSEPIRVLVVTPEAVPLAKTGGLADVAGALPAPLRETGCDVRVVMPCYRAVRESGVPQERCIDALPVELAGGVRPARVLRADLSGGVPCYLIERDEFYDRAHLYGTEDGDYLDNDLRFIYFNRAVFALCRALSFFPHVLHCHDWQAALTPVYLRHLYGETAGFEQTRSLMTIHNLAYQGNFWPGTFARTGLPDSLFTMEGLEFWGNVSFLKGGLVAADLLSTVSPTYAREILRPEFGYGLDGVLAGRAADLHGVLNGADYGEWNPETDGALPVRYGPETVEAGKRSCKEALLEELELGEAGRDAPLFGMISRLTSQKGLDLVVAAAPELVEMGNRFVILGEGEARYRADCESLTRRFPGRFAVRFGFDPGLAHRIQAGCDFLLMPSRYEPCGLNQIYAMRYGTAPVVRSTGGLSDTVDEYDADRGEGTGFLFEAYSPGALVDAVRRAAAVYAGGGDAWRRLRRNGMQQRYTWERSAQAYRRIFERLRQGTRAA